MLNISRMKSLAWLSLLFFPAASQVFLTCNPDCTVIGLESDVEYVPHSRKIRAKKKAAPVKMPTIFTPLTSAELTSAITNSAAGDEIHLSKTVTYTGNFNLPTKSGVVTIRTADMSWSTEGLRARPQDAQFMAKVQGLTAEPVFNLGANIDNWRFLGLQITGSSTVRTFNIIQIGDLNNASALSQLPDTVTVDRCYIYGDSVLGARRGVLAMGTNITVKDSYIENIFDPTSDSSAIGIFGGPGPFLVEDSYLEAAAINVYIAAEAPNLADLFPENITIRGNHIKKKLAWAPPAGFRTKNLFEIKSAQHVTFENNVLENCWEDAQSGYAIVITARYRLGAAIPTISDVTVKYNKVINSANGIVVLGKDSGGSNDGHLFDVFITDNYFENTVGRFAQLLNGIESITFRRNTALSVTNHIWLSDLDGGVASDTITFTDNAIGHGTYGIMHSGTASGLPSITAFWTTYNMSGNYSFPDPGSVYPGFTFVATAASIPSSVGVNLTTLNANIANVVNPWLNVGGGGSGGGGDSGSGGGGGVVTPPSIDTPLPGAAIIAKVASNLNDSGYFYKSADFTDSLQDAYDEIVSITGCYPKATTILATGNKTYYDLSVLIPDFVALRGIYNHRVKRWLIPKTMRWFDTQRDDWEIQNGEPEYFTPVNYRYVAIYPRVTSTSGRLWVFYYAAAGILGSGDNPNLPSVSGDNAIESYITADLFEQAEEWTKAQEYYSEYLKALAEVDKFRNTLRLPDYVDGLR